VNVQVRKKTKLILSPMNHVSPKRWNVVQVSDIMYIKDKYFVA